MFPMAKPAIVTLTIFNLIGKWNAYFLPLIFANTPEMRPIGVWLQTTINSMVVTGNYGGMFAGSHSLVTNHYCLCISIKENYCRSK